MNELQIRLTAELGQLLSALKKAKQVITQFEDETNKISEKGNIGYSRKLGIIEKLTIRAKELRTALSQATNETKITKYNLELEDTSRQLARLNALGRSVTSNLGGTANGFNKLTGSIGNANGVSMEFNRIIQDAPFGLMGIGNNIQQLTANFAQLKAGGASTGAVIKASLAAMISPANLLVLGISAVTAAFTAYQMGAFDFLKSNDEAVEKFDILKNSLDKTKESLNALNSARSQGASSAESEIAKVDLLIAVIDDETLSRERRLAAFAKLQKIQPQFFGSITAEQALITGLKNEYNALTAAIFAKAAATAIEEKAGELAAKRIDLIERERQETDLQNQLLAKRANLTSEISKLQVIISKEFGKGSTTSAGFSEALARNKAELVLLNDELSTLGVVSDVTNRAVTENAKSTDLLKEAYKQTSIELEGFLDTPIEAVLDRVIEKVDETTRSFEKLPKGFEEALNRINLDRFDLFNQKIEQDITVESGKANTQGIITPDQNILNTTELLKDQKLSVDDLSGAFTGLGSLIGKAFDNPSLGQFLGQFIAFAAKVVAANFSIASSNAIAGASSAALATGPAAPISLPAFIAGALGVVAAAFAGLGGGGGRGASKGGGGGGFTSSSPPQIFTNKNTVQPPTPTGSPNFNSGDIDFTNAQSRLTVDVNGDYLQFILDRNKERKAGG